MIRNNPSVRIKVPFSLYKKANQRKLMPIIKYYYRVKSLRIDGCFNDRKLINILIDQLKVSYNTARKIRLSLLNNNFAYLKDNHFYLISYEKLWLLLEVDKIDNSYKLIYTTNNKIDRHVYLAEIKYNLEKQQENLDKKYLSKKLHTDAEKDQALQKQFDLIRKKLTSKVNINNQVTLTCHRTAKIFGLKSYVQGHRILRMMVYSKKLKCDRQRALMIKENVSNDEFEHLHLDQSFFLTSDNVLKKRLPNLISIF